MPLTTTEALHKTGTACASYGLINDMEENR